MIQTRDSRKASTKGKEMLVSFAPLVGLVLITLIFAILTDGRTVSAMNLKILTNQMIVTAIVSTGAIFAFSCGALDMSLSGSVCLSAIVGAIIGIKTGSVTLMFLAVIILSLAVALFKGVVAAYLKLPIFIVTIVFSSVLSSTGLVLLGKNTTLSVGNILPTMDLTVINVLFIACFYLVSMIIFNYTKVGKSCKLQGGNLIASAQSGINEKVNIIISFLMGGIGVALAAIILLLQTKTASPATGGSIGTDVMVAIVLGGMPLSGGPRSRISAAIIGAVTITVLNNGLAVIGLSTGSIQIVRGVIFLAVVFVTSMTYRTKLLPR